MAQQWPGQHPAPPTPLVNLAASLVQSAMAPSSQVSYYKTFQLFKQFCSHTLQVSPLPASSASILTYVAHLYQLGYASSSIHSNISIISYYHKLYQLDDPTASFLVKKVLAGVSKSIPSRDLRAPITPSLLLSLVNSCPFISKSQYNSDLMSAMYLLAFHAFLRIGEITVNQSKSSNPNLIQLHQISLSNDQAVLTFSAFKHHHGPPVTLVIQSHHSSACPVSHLCRYITVRGPSAGPLFQFPNGTPVSRNFFLKQLSASLAWSNCSSQFIKSHSFRIGAATAAAASGHSEESIQRMGRWKSTAFKKYIRIPSLILG
jgi:hypothetical protein